MSQISETAAAARESHRDPWGKFGTQSAAESATLLGESSSQITLVTDALEDAGYPPESVRLEGDFVRVRLNDEPGRTSWLEVSLEHTDDGRLEYVTTEGWAVHEGDGQWADDYAETSRTTDLGVLMLGLNARAGAAGLWD